MAYTKKTWVSGETPLSAENMNHIEQGITDAHNDINSLNTNLNKVNPYSGQLQSATDGTKGRVAMFTVTNNGYLDFSTNDMNSYRLVIGADGFYMYKYENGTITASKQIASF